MVSGPALLPWRNVLGAPPCSAGECQSASECTSTDISWGLSKYCSTAQPAPVPVLMPFHTPQLRERDDRRQARQSDRHQFAPWPVPLPAAAARCRRAADNRQLVPQVRLKPPRCRRKLHEPIVVRGQRRGARRRRARGAEGALLALWSMPARCSHAGRCRARCSHDHATAQMLPPPIRKTCLAALSPPAPINTILHTPPCSTRSRP